MNTEELAYLLSDLLSRDEVVVPFDHRGEYFHVRDDEGNVFQVQVHLRSRADPDD